MKSKGLNVPVLSDIGHRHSCFGEITEVGDTNIRNINDYKENTGYVMEESSIYNNNNNNNGIVSLASAIDIYSNNTCNIKHGALSAQVSVLSCITTWGQPDSSLEMGYPPFALY